MFVVVELFLGVLFFVLVVHDPTEINKIENTTQHWDMKEFNFSGL
jgi:hypothetical protein